MTEAHLPPDELVSRYFDDDVSAELRAVVEADPNLLAQVERVRSLREMLRDGDPLDPVRREAMLAAAVAAFDAELGDRSLAATRSAAVVSLRARRWRRALAWAGGVAAASVVAVGGSALLRDEPTPVADKQATSLPATSPFAAAEPEGGSASDTVSAGLAEAMASDSLSTEAPEARSDDVQGSEPFPMPPAGVSVVLDDQEMFEQFARSAEPVPLASLDPADVPCREVGTDLLLVAEAIYAGTTVTIFYDDVAGEAIAYEVDSCQVVARAQR